MTYDQQPNFKVIIVVDYQSDEEPSRQEKLLMQSSFLAGVGISTYPDPPSFDSIVAETNSVEYQINTSGSQSFSNRNIFNRMYRAIVLCYCAIIIKKPKLRMVPFKRILDILSFIKVKNLPVEFNIFTVIGHVAKIMSNQVADVEERREI